MSPVLDGDELVADDSDVRDDEGVRERAVDDDDDDMAILWTMSGIAAFISFLHKVLQLQAIIFENIHNPE